ncbi:hypothetical protein DUNSADRAFT_3602 [Dunaliella salina]|uniref:SHSP domain-containing protein n=1 Tax=Dunaliella salina TaxID=3046 RepID=A0ABQ7GTY6_DUNSA|nr:hypothetical protein DUNSADRAFT_3602 [Dunaliella salina]|eukprot:KAF5838009.1 hypothetical protein DUNSADRAFT_3602 [Dunaliella salina]
MVASEVAAIGARESHITCHPQGPTGGNICIERHFEGLEDPAKELKLQVQQKTLLITAKGCTEKIELPADAYTDQLHAKYQRGNLKVDIMSKDPSAPAMQEKEVFDPDRQPRDIEIEMPRNRPGALSAFHANETPAHPPDTVGHGASTPAQASVDAGAPHRPAGLEAFGGGETVGPDYSKADTKMLVPEGLERTVHQGGGDVSPAGRASEEARMLQAGIERGWVPEGSTVVYGRRDKAVEEQYGTASKPYADAAAAAHQQYEGVVPAGEESEYEYIEVYSSEEEQQGQQHTMHEPVDFAQEKVGLATREKLASDYYPRSDDHEYRPLSTLKDQVSAPQTKRTGKPKMKKVRKPVTGRNSHVARDFRMHAKPQNEEKTRAGSRSAGFSDNFEYSDEKVSIARMEEEEAHHGSSLRRPKVAAERAGKVVDEMAGSPTAWKNTYTGGRVISGDPSNMHLGSSTHEAPHTLG